MDPHQLRDLVLGNLSPEESLRVLSKVEGDPEASRELDFYVDLARFVREEGESVFADVPVVRGRSTVAYLVGAIKRFIGEPRLVYGSVGAVVGLIAVLTGVSALVTDRYHDLARVDQVVYVTSARGPENHHVDIAQRLYEAGEEERALEELERYLRAYPSSAVGDYASYLAGAINLVVAERTVAGLFPRYDRQVVEDGLRHLEAAGRKTNNSRLREEITWLQAKAFLMLGESDEALRLAEELSAREGLRAAAADSLMALLRKGG